MTLFYNNMQIAIERPVMLLDVQPVFACDRVWTSECMEPPYTCLQQG